MKWRSCTMKIELDDEVLYQLKDAVMIDFLKDDLNTVIQIQHGYVHKDDVKFNKKLIKAYKTVLKYYGVYND